MFTSSMPEKIKVFVSYSHDDTPVKEALLRKLESDPLIEVRCDIGNDELPEHLHRAISQNINWADIVIPILTTNWMHSHECRDELVRANERRKKIVVFRSADLKEDKPPKLPFFLRELLSIQWDNRNLNTAIADLLSRLKSLSVESWVREGLQSIRKIGDSIEHVKSVPRWKSSLSRHLLKQAERGVKQVLSSDVCSFDVSHENSYLRFANPIFQSADNIIAVCVAAISTFWTNPDFRGHAHQYLSNQVNAKYIKRLFVFDSPEEVNAFKNILEEHHKRYGDRDGSAVFFCTSEVYQELVHRWDSAAEQNALKEDFGLLGFSDSEDVMEAILNAREFRYRLFNNEDIEESKNQLIFEQFEKFLAVKPGDFHPTWRIARWSSKLVDDDEAFAKMLTKMFGERRGIVTHNVLLRPSGDSQEFADYLYAAARRFYEKRSILKIVDVQVHRRLSINPIDGRFGGHLKILPDFSYNLQLVFATEEALKHYYVHELHSLEREKLYCRLDPSIIEQYLKLNEVPSSDSGLRRKMFESIEEHMTSSGFILRIDSIDDEPIENIVQRPSIQFRRVHCREIDL